MVEKSGARRAVEDPPAVDEAPAVQAAPAQSRPSVVIVTYSWGHEWVEAAAAVRLLGGALALTAGVTIVNLEDPAETDRGHRRVRHDGAFRVHSGDSMPSHEERADLLQTAFLRQPGSVMPDRATRGTLGLRARAGPAALSLINDLRPDVLVLAGTASFFPVALSLGDLPGSLVLLPLCGDDPLLSSDALRPVLSRADCIGVFSEAEERRVGEALGHARDRGRVERLRVALPVNQLAAMTEMAGMAPFGRYMLVISGLPGDAHGASPLPHDFLREVLGDVAVAEVGARNWVVTGGADRFEISWTPSRMMLWRLMAGADVMLDVRRQGPIGRESVECMRFGTPIVVPERSVAAEHAAASNGGLWYRAPGEMTDCVATLLAGTPLRDSLGRNGKAWSERWHDDTTAFVQAARRLAFGEQAPA